MKLTPELLARIGAWTRAVDAFAERFPEGLDVTGDPDPDVIRRLVERPTVAGRVAVAVLNRAAHERYIADTDETWEAYNRGSPSEADAQPEEHRAAHDAYAMACGLSLWALLSHPNNIRPEFR